MQIAVTQSNKKSTKKCLKNTWNSHGFAAELITAHQRCGKCNVFSSICLSVHIPYCQRAGGQSSIEMLSSYRNSSCGKVMFYRCLSVHGGDVCLGDVCDLVQKGVHTLGRHPQADTPLGRHPPDGHCSGRCTSYWNELLFE